MADNTTLNAGTGGDTLATDDIGGVKYQRVKLAVGADGAASDAVPVSAGMDVTGAAVQAVGIVAQLDDTASAAVTENQFAPVRMSTRRALLIEGVASGTAVTVNGSAVTQPVSGTVTANAGTNLNTSALALEAGGNLAAAATSLAAVDDWDESDRAKVNPIVGQAGIAAGAGAVGVTVPRVTLASDDPAVTALQLIDNAVSGAGFNITQLGSAAVPIGNGTEAAAVRVTLATDSTGVLSVDDNGGALTVDGSITANAGTNLNTSALALEAGGNLADVKTSTGVMDDWDDGADRCKTIEAADVSLDGTTVCTVKRFHVVTSTDGATIIAAVANKKFRIRSLSVFATSVTVTNVWFEDADGTDVFGDSTGIPVDCDGGNGPAGFVLGHNPDGWFQTPTANKNLVVKLTAAQKVVIVGTYIEVA